MRKERRLGAAEAQSVTALKAGLPATKFSQARNPAKVRFLSEWHKDMGFEDGAEFVWRLHQKAAAMSSLGDGGFSHSGPHSGNLGIRILILRNPLSHVAAGNAGRYGACAKMSSYDSFTLKPR